MGIGDTRYRGWANTRLDRHILDYLLRRGYADTARRMVHGDASLQTLSDVEVGLFSELDTITAALSRGSATQALAWCKDNAAALKKVKSTLEFDLRFQEFIQLARQAKRHEAIAYCRKHLVPSATATSSGSARIRSAMALLAFGPETTCPPYRAMYDISRWNILADTFRRAFLAFYALPPLPLFNLSIWAGLAGLKLPACASSSDKEHNTDCPTCVSSGLGHFATLAHQPQVPMGHHVNSVIVCKITGKVLAGEDTAYALPNGNVYSGEALEELAKKGNGSIKDPRSDSTYEWRDLKKVYIT
jgi:macrophage erythroblast attacher